MDTATAEALGREAVQEAKEREVSTPEREAASAVARDEHYGELRCGTSPHAFQLGYMYAMRDAAVRAAQGGS